MKLYGGKAERFEDIKQRIADDWGYEPSNAEVVGVLMGLVRVVGLGLVGAMLIGFEPSSILTAVALPSGALTAVPLVL